MEIKRMNLSDLTPADYNPRIDLVPGMDEYEKLKQSIQEFGFVDPPIYNKQTGNLVGGHQRVQVAKDLGIEEIQVSIIDMPLEKEKQLNIALNKISGQWDDEKLASLLKSFSEEDISFTGFKIDEVTDLLKTFEQYPDNELGDFQNAEIDLGTFDDDKFDCQCPKCGFKFDRE